MTLYRWAAHHFVTHCAQVCVGVCALCACAQRGNEWRSWLTMLCTHTGCSSVQSRIWLRFSPTPRVRGAKVTTSLPLRAHSRVHTRTLVSTLLFPFKKYVRVKATLSFVSTLQIENHLTVDWLVMQRWRGVPYWPRMRLPWHDTFPLLCLELNYQPSNTCDPLDDSVPSSLLHLSLLIHLAVDGSMWSVQCVMERQIFAKQGRGDGKVL